MKKILYFVIVVLVIIATILYFQDKEVPLEHCFCTHDSIAETDSCIIIECSTTKQLYKINKKEYANRTKR